MATFSQRLEDERKKRGLTQRGLALELKVPVSEVVFYELGDKKPDVDTLNKLADLFNVSIDYLLCRSNQRQDPNLHVKEVLSKDPVLHEFWEEISRREDLQLLFKQTRNLDEESIYKVIEIIKTIEDEERIRYGG
jgi:transcriptional regulator with XRE-family HTH domain